MSEKRSGGRGERGREIEMEKRGYPRRRIEKRIEGKSGERGEKRKRRRGQGRRYVHEARKSLGRS
jgi:hypothetical protein